MVNFSCKTCTKRTSTCHITCETYLAESALNEKQRDQKRKQALRIELHSNGTYFSGSRGAHRKRPR